MSRLYHFLLRRTPDDLITAEANRIRRRSRYRRSTL